MEITESNIVVIAGPSHMSLFFESSLALQPLGFIASQLHA